MRYLAALLLLIAAANPSAEIRYFHFQRPVENAPAAEKQACFVIDPAIFSHAAPGLADLRLYRGSAEVPYAVQTAEPLSDSNQALTPVNLGRRGRETVFDAAMPAGGFRDVELSVSGQNFIATVVVSGSQEQTGAETRLGSFTIFDLSNQKLGRSTVLHLPKSDFRYLHFRIDGPIAPEAIKGLTVLRSAAVAPRYVAVSGSQQIAQKGRESVIEFTVPTNTPVDRVIFVAGAQPANFSRDVRIRIVPASPPKQDTDEPPQPIDTFANILRVHRVENGHAIDEERLSVDAPVGLPADATKWTVTIENGDDAPIALNSVRLEMVERDLCFDVAAGGTYLLYYGDSAVAAPRYDYATLFTRQPDAAQASVGPEIPNPAFQPRPDTRPLTERYPALLWIALAAAIGMLGLVALRTARQQAGATK